MAELTCPGCGKQLTEYTRFCPECGARLPEPQAEPPVTPPPGGLRTVVLPPGDAPAAQAPESGAAPIPPTVRLDVPAQPAPQPVGALPTADPTSVEGPVAPAPPKSRRALWWILGGVGCLSVLLLGACVTIGLLTFLGQRVETISEQAAPTSIPEGGVVLGGGSGEVTLEDDFSDPEVSNLDVSEDETSRSAYEDGAYVLEVKVPETLVWVVVGGPLSDIDAELEAELPAGEDVVAAGLVFHYQDDENFYLFSVTNDGYYTLEVLQNGEWATLINPTPSDEIESDRNRLQVVTEGDRIALYVNGSLLEETVDGTFTSGEVGLAASTFENSAGAVRFNDFAAVGSE
jgi:hypothetical protein